MHYVYVLKNQKGHYYIGYTANLILRLKNHKFQHPGYKIIYYEAYNSNVIARKREKKLKYYGSAWRALKSRLASLEGGVQ